MKEQIKTPEKELSNKKIEYLSDTEFKTLVIRMLTERTEVSCKMKGEMKAMQNKGKYSEPTVKEGNWDSEQQFGTKGRNQHRTGTE